MKVSDTAVVAVLQNRGSEKFRKVHEKTYVSESLYNKAISLRSRTLLKETPTQEFS